MGHIEGTGREQTTFWTLEDMVGDESMVRVIDRFVDVLDLEQLGFGRTKPKDTGRPGYSAGVLVRLFVYGYENGIRSSRKLERECTRNVEVMWLVQNLKPDHKTIAEFRKENIRPLQKLFREFVRLCRSWELIGGELFAVDGTKIKASNNKKGNFSAKKLAKRIAHLDEKIEAWFQKAEEEDTLEDSEHDMPQGLLGLLERRELYEDCLEELERTGTNEVSLTDCDARLMGNNRGGVDVAYNVQSTVDAKCHVIADFDVSLNPTDHGQLDNMSKRLIRQGYRGFGMLADKGYYNGDDLEKCEKRKVKAIVARQASPGGKDQDRGFGLDRFSYDKTTDTYTCPQGQTLFAKSKTDTKRHRYFNKEACVRCPNQTKCTGKNSDFRIITRGEHADTYDRADRAFSDNYELYRRRQQIVEHPFGTIKYTMGCGHFLLRTRRKVRTEVALVFLGYNLKRALKVLGFEEIMARLESHVSCFLRLLLFWKEDFSISAVNRSYTVQNAVA